MQLTTAFVVAALALATVVQAAPVSIVLESRTILEPRGSEDMEGIAASSESLSTDRFFKKTPNNAANIKAFKLAYGENIPPPNSPVASLWDSAIGTGGNKLPLSKEGRLWMEQRLEYRKLPASQKGIVAGLQKLEPFKGSGKPEEETVYVRPKHKSPGAAATAEEVLKRFKTYNEGSGAKRSAFVPKLFAGRLLENTEKPPAVLTFQAPPTPIDEVRRQKRKAPSLSYASGWHADKLSYASGWNADKLSYAPGWHADKLSYASGWNADKVTRVPPAQLRELPGSNKRKNEQEFTLEQLEDRSRRSKITPTSSVDTRVTGVSTLSDVQSEDLRSTVRSTESNGLKRKGGPHTPLLDLDPTKSLDVQKVVTQSLDGGFEGKSVEGAAKLVKLFH